MPAASTTRTWATTLCLLALLAVLVWGQSRGQPAQVRDAKEVALVACQSNNEMRRVLRSYILQQIDRTKRTLPTLEYYKNRPVELGRALANIEEQRAETRASFAPTDC